MDRDEIVARIAETKRQIPYHTRRANSLKILNNGTFGKLGSKWSLFYAPSELIQVTVTGQLALLMLIERLELSGIRVMSANTDGIVCCYTPAQEWLYKSIIHWWEQLTGFTMEFTDYTLVAARDVNSYVAITTDGKVKLKGAFAPPDPGPSGWPNPTTQVCVDAVVAYLKAGTPLATTILACRDVRQFIAVRTVKGGGMWRDEYLGRVVRWYYSNDGDVITYKSNGNHVPDTAGARPMMRLTETVPEDIDYAWYIDHAEKLLTSAGIHVKG